MPRSAMWAKCATVPRCACSRRPAALAAAAAPLRLQPPHSCACSRRRAALAAALDKLEGLGSWARQASCATVRKWECWQVWPKLGGLGKVGGLWASWEGWASREGSVVRQGRQVVQQWDNWKVGQGGLCCKDGPLSLLIGSVSNPCQCRRGIGSGYRLRVSGKMTLRDYLGPFGAFRIDAG